MGAWDSLIDVVSTIVDISAVSIVSARSPKPAERGKGARSNAGGFYPYKNVICRLRSLKYEVPYADFDGTNGAKFTREGVPTG